MMARGDAITAHADVELDVSDVPISDEYQGVGSGRGTGFNIEILLSSDLAFAILLRLGCDRLPSSRHPGTGQMAWSTVSGGFFVLQAFEAIMTVSNWIALAVFVLAALGMGGSILCFLMRIAERLGTMAASLKRIEAGPDQQPGRTPRTLRDRGRASRPARRASCPPDHAGRGPEERGSAPQWGMRFCGSFLTKRQSAKGPGNSGRVR